MPHFYTNHTHLARQRLVKATSPQSFGAVVGTVDTSSEHEITGRSGEHLQFYVDIHPEIGIQVDVNVLSRDGSAIEVHIADEILAGDPANPQDPFGPPVFGVFGNAQLSYAALGLKDGDFTPMSDNRIQGQLEAALNQSSFVSVYGQVFDDGGARGRGIHETHFDANAKNQDGAVAIYVQDGTTGKLKRTWFFFKFARDRIG